MKIENLTPREVNFISFFCVEKIGEMYYENNVDLKYLDMDYFFTLLKKNLYKLNKESQIIAKNLILKR